MYVYMCPTYVPADHRGLRRVKDAPNKVYRHFLICHVGTENQTQVIPSTSAVELLFTSPAPHILIAQSIFILVRKEHYKLLNVIVYNNLIKS